MVDLDDLLMKAYLAKLLLAKSACKKPSLIPDRFKFDDIGPR